MGVGISYKAGVTGDAGGKQWVPEARSVYLDVEDVKQWVPGIREARSGNLS